MSYIKRLHEELFSVANPFKLPWIKYIAARIITLLFILVLIFYYYDLKRDDPIKKAADLDLVILRSKNFHPSPKLWGDQVLYLLMPDRFSDGNEKQDLISKLKQNSLVKEIIDSNDKTTIFTTNGSELIPHIFQISSTRSWSIFRMRTIYEVYQVL